jgi:hypothetical protein
MPTSLEPSSRFAADRDDFFCMQFHRVLQVLHVDELPQALESAKRVQGREHGVSISARLTPDTWACGDFSGNVALEYDWLSLTRGCRFYWLGTDPRVPRLCRFLVTTGSRPEGLPEYDPRVDSGPWRVEEFGAHTWNSRFGLEFLFEGDIAVTEVNRVFCVKHDPRRCEIRGPQCPDLGLGARAAGARVLAILGGSSLTAARLAQIVNSSDAQLWLSALLRKLSRFSTGGLVRSGTSEARELAHQTVAAFGRHGMPQISRFDETVCFARRRRG